MYQFLSRITGFSFEETIKLFLKVKEMKTEDLQEWLESSKQGINYSTKVRTKRMIVIDELIKRKEIKNKGIKSCNK
ncbi:MAG: hypothetical protein K9K32_00075 [Halanaerobiales bacterium]|nr:hypothetical protein [Halanaerobiales bacterium]